MSLFQKKGAASRGIFAAATPRGTSSSLDSLRKDEQDDLMAKISFADAKVHLVGHRALADLMGRNRDVAIFRRYAFLNNLNLVYLQAEIERLEVDLADTAREDAESRDKDRMEYAVDFDMLKDKNDSQWQIILQIRGLLREYNEALLQQIQLGGHRNPEKHKLEALQNYLRSKSMAMGLTIKGADSIIWETEAVNEFVVLQGAKQDPLSRWIEGSFVGWWVRTKKRFGRRKRPRTPESEVENAIIEYDGEPYSLLAALISTLVSVFILNTCVISLYFIQNMFARLMVASAFTLIFSLALTLTTEARKVEVFAATCAFAAVQIVYVGSTLATQGSREGAKRI